VLSQPGKGPGLPPRLATGSKQAWDNLVSMVTDWNNFGPRKQLRLGDAPKWPSRCTQGSAPRGKEVRTASVKSQGRGVSRFL
jgi:hypothetical protein